MRQRDISNVFGTNFCLQITASALVVGIIFDSTINVPNAIIASHLAVMLSTCNVTVNAPHYSYIDKMRRLKTKLLWLDHITNSLLIACNLAICVDIGKLQKDSSVCPDGAGKWVFFGIINDISGTTAASNFVVGSIVIISTQHIMGVIADGVRTIYLSSTALIRPEEVDVELDVILWWIRESFRQHVVYYGSRWESLQHALIFIQICQKWFM